MVQGQVEIERGVYHGINAVILFLGAMASIWMVVSLAIKLKQNKTANKHIDTVLLYVAVSDFVCCSIKSFFSAISAATGEPYWSPKDDVSRVVMELSHVAMVASCLWQVVLTLLILRLVQYRGHMPLDLWVFHYVVWPLTLTRGLQGALDLYDAGLPHYYAMSQFTLSWLLVALVLTRIQVILKQKRSTSTSGMFERIRLFPVVFLVCIAPRLLYLTIRYIQYRGMPPEGKHLDPPLAHQLTNFLFYSFYLCNCFVYGASRSCFSLELFFGKAETKSKDLETSTGMLEDRTPQQTAAADLVPAAIRIDPEEVDDFDQLNVIGSGSQGVIYTGTYRKTPVVIKQIRLRPVPVHAKARFQHQLTAFTRFVHPNIVSFMGIHMQGSYVYLILEYCNRGSLRSILDYLHRNQRRNHCIDWRWRCTIALGAARGLLYLHQTAKPTMTHGRLKSSKILVSEYFTAKVADYITPRLLSIANHDAGIDRGGFERWTAPEILTSGSTALTTMTRAADIFSFGMILWELATFELPFHQIQKDSEAHQAIAAGKRPYYSLQSTRTPEGWSKLVLACWAQSPQERPDATTVLERLETMLDAFATASSSSPPCTHEMPSIDRFL